MQPHSQWLACLHDRAWKRALLASASGGIFSLSFLQPSLFVCCWIGLVPWLWSLRAVSVRHAYFLGSLAGVAFYVCGTYWIGEFLRTLKGYGPLQSTAGALLFWLYSAQAAGLIAALFVWLRQARVLQEAWLFALVFVGVYSVFPTLFVVRPGESQSQFITALQGVEFTGVHGLDFLIVLVNATLYGITLGARELRLKPLLLTCSLLLAWFGYGLHAQALWRERTAAAATLRIGLVQPNEAPSIALPDPVPGYSRAYPFEMALTEQLAAAGAQVAVWPETRFKGYFANEFIRRSFQHQIAALQLPLIFQDAEWLSVAGSSREYNTALFLDRHGQLAGSYRKIQRIAFGEYLPLVTDIPALDAWASAYLGDFLSPIARGEGPAVFRGDGWAMVPMICYEAMFPGLIARSVTDQPRGKILLALSNDSWFGNTRQPYIHLHSSALRAVENRLPLLHVLNNGPSTFITPDGRFFFQAEFRTAGGYVVDVPYSPNHGGSLFSRHPYGFIGTLQVALACLVLRAAWLQRQRKRSRDKKFTQPPPSPSPVPR